jgi:hypothetical protein
MIENVFYTVVTNTGTALAALSSGNYVVQGYSLLSSGASAVLSINDSGSFLMGIPSTAAANSVNFDKAKGVKCKGAITVTGVSTNVSNITIFYSVSA